MFGVAKNVGARIIVYTHKGISLPIFSQKAQKKFFAGGIGGVTISSGEILFSVEGNFIDNPLFFAKKHPRGVGKKTRWFATAVDDYYINRRGESLSL